MHRLDLRNPAPSEWDEQAALFDWANLQAAAKWPELYLLNSSQNGAQLVSGPAQAARLKRTGLKPGFPDIGLPVPRAGYHGLYIELKRTNGGRASEDQLWWLRILNRMGYQTAICHGFDQAMAVIVDYLESEPRGETFKIQPPPALTRTPAKPRTNRHTSRRQREIRL